MVRRIFQFLDLIRVRQWVKNLLVLFPVFFSGHMADAIHMHLAVASFFSFSLVASFVYVLNDVSDAEKDRLHPRKRNRPIASGQISVPIALTFGLLLLVLGIALCLLVAAAPMRSFVVLVVYVGLNLGYSFGLKRIPVVDVTILAFGFVLRIIYGGYACGISISSWLFLTVFAFSFYLALGKRKGELAKQGCAARDSLKAYTLEFLKKNMSVFAALGLTFYSLWSFQRVENLDASIGLRTLAYVLAIVVAIIIYLRYSFDLECREDEGDPTEILIHDAFLIALVVLWIACIFVGVYVG